MTVPLGGGGREMPGFAATILLMTWRDARFVDAALAGAVAQTVPCEIIVSNDASDDGTHARAEAFAATYRGPHRIIVRRNERNLGVSGHVNAVLPLASAPLIVMMAGDDISEPERVARLLAVFDAEPEVMAIGSGFIAIDAGGAPTPLRMRGLPARFGIAHFVAAGRLIGLLGASLALRREVFDAFGPLRGPIEDNALSLRAALLGRCAWLPAPLLRYRQHAGSVSAGVFARGEDAAVAKRRRYERTIAFYRGTADDLEACLSAGVPLACETRRDAVDVARMYRLEAEAREAMLLKPRRDWVGPVLRGLAQRGLRRKSAERALKLLLPRRWQGLD